MKEAELRREYTEIKAPSNGIVSRKNVVLMYGFQSEPTPVGSNNLARIPRWRERTGLEIGFMDHADGGGRHALTLSAMALALGVRVFEKHISLDRTLKLEDYVSALGPGATAARRFA